MQERQEKIWTSPPLPGTGGRWLQYSIHSRMDLRTGDIIRQVEIREFGPLGTHGGETGPYKYSIIFPLSIWGDLRQAAFDCEQALTERGLLPAPMEEWRGACNSADRSDIASTKMAGGDFIKITLETQREIAGSKPRSKCHLILVAHGRSGSGDVIPLGPGLTLNRHSFLAFIEHLGQVEKILQGRGLLQAPQAA